MAIKLKSTARGNNGKGDWYRQETELLSGVTSNPVNLPLGIKDILIFDPSQLQEEKGMVCAVMIKTTVGDIRGTVYESKNHENTLYLRPPQSREEKEDGEVVFHDEVKFEAPVVAQVLRYIETQVDITAEEVVEDGNYGALGTVGGNQGFVQTQGEVQGFVQPTGNGTVTQTFVQPQGNPQGQPTGQGFVQPTGNQGQVVNQGQPQGQQVAGNQGFVQPTGQGQVGTGQPFVQPQNPAGQQGNIQGGDPFAGMN